MLRRQMIYAILAGIFSLCVSTQSPLLGEENTPSVSQETQKNISQAYWHSSYSEGLKEAQAKGLPIYLSFTAPDWCSFCKIMEDKIYSSPDFTNMVNDKFVFIRLLLPRSGNTPKETQELLERFHISGIPVAVILSSDGTKEIARFGYTRMPPKVYAEHILLSTGTKI